jgi:hypothetical protein
MKLDWNNLSPDVQRRNMHLKQSLEPARESKYGNQRVTIDGILFDSQKEAEKYCELKMLRQIGEVTRLETQPAFLLQEAYWDDKNKYVRPIIYKADFRVTYRDGRVEVIDTKGFRTKEYLLKKKLFLKKYPGVNFIEC